MGKRSQVRNSNEDCDTKEKKLKLSSRKKKELTPDAIKLATEDIKTNLEIANESLITTDRKLKKKKRKAREHQTEEFVLDDTDKLATPAEKVKEINVEPVNEEGGKKSKKKKFKTKKHQTEDPGVTVEFTTETEEKKVENVEALNKSGDASYKKSTKRIFIDDTRDEATANSGNIKSRTKNKNKRKLNDDEAEVKDEDIDKFCDELNDDDNVHFENWVKLIEAKMHKKKSE